jgi:hypothetical protein
LVAKKELTQTCCQKLHDIEEISCLFKHSKPTELEKSEGQNTQEISQGERVGSTLVFCDPLGEQHQEHKLDIRKHGPLKISLQSFKWMTMFCLERCQFLYLAFD